MSTSPPTTETPTTSIQFLDHAGSTVYTDGLKSFAGLQEVGFLHVARIQPLRIDLRKGAKSVLHWQTAAIGNLHSNG